MFGIGLFRRLIVASNMETLLPTNIDRRTSWAIFLCHWGLGKRKSGLIPSSIFVSAPPGRRHRRFGTEKKLVAPVAPAKEKIDFFRAADTVAQNLGSEGGDGVWKSKR